MWRLEFSIDEISISDFIHFQVKTFRPEKNSPRIFLILENFFSFLVDIWGASQLRTGCLSILMFLTPLAEVTP